MKRRRLNDFGYSLGLALSMLVVVAMALLSAIVLLALGVLLAAGATYLAATHPVLVLLAGICVLAILGLWLGAGRHV